MALNDRQLDQIVEGALLAAGEPLSQERLLGLFDAFDDVSRERVRESLERLASACDERGVELQQVASGWRLQVRQSLAPWVSRLQESRSPRYSRAMLETLAVIAYQQPVTRSDIEFVRGVSVSSNIIKTLLERDWIRILGHRDVPGRPALYGTTRAFLDYFNLRALDQLPPLAEIRDLDAISNELGLEVVGLQENDDGAQSGDTTAAEPGHEQLRPTEVGLLPSAGPGHDSESQTDTTASAEPWRQEDRT